MYNLSFIKSFELSTLKHLKEGFAKSLLNSLFAFGSLATSSMFSLLLYDIPNESRFLNKDFYSLNRDDSHSLKMLWDIKRVLNTVYFLTKLILLLQVFTVLLLLIEFHHINIQLAAIKEKLDTLQDKIEELSNYLITKLNSIENQIKRGNSLIRRNYHILKKQNKVLNHEKTELDEMNHSLKSEINRLDEQVKTLGENQKQSKKQIHNLETSINDLTNTTEANNDKDRSKEIRLIRKIIDIIDHASKRNRALTNNEVLKISNKLSTVRGMLDRN